MTITGPDLSSWKAVGDWGLVAQGNDFMITKCTGGLTYNNNLYRAQVAGARAVKLEVGHFHYLHESSRDMATMDEMLSTARGVAEAEHFLRQLDLWDGEPTALDVEDPAVFGVLTRVIMGFAERVQRATNEWPMLYTYPYYKIERGIDDPVLTQLPLWWADYDRAYATDPWPRYSLLQYTASAQVPGVYSDLVDMNEFPGTREEFRALGSTVPVVTPGPDPVTGVWVHEYFRGVWQLGIHGRPRQGAALYTDGVTRQLFENVVLEGTGRGEPRQGGLGQLVNGYPDWPGVHPLL